MVDRIVELAVASGAKPFKGATGDWADSIEVALVDTVLSVGASKGGHYGAGVLPRLRALRAFRGQANMLNVTVALGAGGLTDFIEDDETINTILQVAQSLVGHNVRAAADVDPQSTEQAAVFDYPALPDTAWQYFLLALGVDTATNRERAAQWIQDFLHRALGHETDPAQHDELLAAAAKMIDAQQQKASWGMFPEFTVAQLQQAILRAEYARSSARAE